MAFIFKWHSYPKLIDGFKHAGKYYISTKMDGTSVAMYRRNGHFGICGRNYEYADCDKWNMYSYLQNLIPEMLQDMRDNRHGSPVYLGENYTNEEGILVNDTCHIEWDKILDNMIFLWRESNEDTCTKNNPYAEKYYKAHDEFEEKYGFLGEKLQTETELEENRKRGGGGTIHFMNELPQYKEISDKYFEEQHKIEEYRNKCKDEALDLLKEHFYALWD